MAWYDFATSQGYGVNGETGIDIATPFHTAVSMLFGGTVKSATYEPWGGDVEVETTIPGLGSVTEYLIHLDEIAPGIVAGAHISAGQYIGLSGGENAGYPGAEHPAAKQFSTGPHVEWGIKSGSGPVNPTGYISQARSGGLGDVAPTPPAATGSPASFGGGVASAITGPLGQLLTGIGVGQLPPWQDIAGVVIGGVMVSLGVWVIIQSLIAPAVQEGAEKVAKAAPEIAAAA